MDTTGSSCLFQCHFTQGEDDLQMTSTAVGELEELGGGIKT